MSSYRPKLALSAFASFFLASSAAFAGFQTSNNVNIFDNLSVFGSPPYGEAYGDLGFVHNSADQSQLIECYNNNVPAASGPTYGFCFVQSAGISRLCYTTDPNMLAVIRSIKRDSYLIFEWHVNDGQCMEIEVTNDSATAPKR